MGWHGVARSGQVLDISACVSPELSVLGDELDATCGREETRMLQGQGLRNRDPEDKRSRLRAEHRCALGQVKVSRPLHT